MGTRPQIEQEYMGKNGFIRLLSRDACALFLCASKCPIVRLYTKLVLEPSKRKDDISRG